MKTNDDVIIPRVVGALGAKHKLLIEQWLALLELHKKRFNNIQQMALLGSSTRILSKMLSIFVWALDQ